MLLCLDRQRKKIMLLFIYLMNIDSTKKEQSYQVFWKCKKILLSLYYIVRRSEAFPSDVNMLMKCRTGILSFYLWILVRELHYSPLVCLGSVSFLLPTADTAEEQGGYYMLR